MILETQSPVSEFRQTLKYYENQLISGPVEGIEKLQILWSIGAGAKFQFCIELNKIVDAKKVKKKSLKAFYKSIGVTSRYAQKLKIVGQVYRHYSSVQVDAYSISQLIRMAALNETGKYIVDSKLRFKVKELDLIASSLTEYHPSNFIHPKEFELKLADHLKSIVPKRRNVGEGKGEEPPEDEDSDAEQNPANKPGRDHLGRKIQGKSIFERILSKCEIMEHEITMINSLISTVRKKSIEHQVSFVKYTQNEFDLEGFIKDVANWIIRLNKILRDLEDRETADDYEGKGTLSAARQ